MLIDDINGGKTKHLTVKKATTDLNNLNSDLILDSNPKSNIQKVYTIDRDTCALDHTTVQIDVRCVLASLSIKDRLSNIRKILEKNAEVKMDNTLSFAKNCCYERSLALKDKLTNI